MTFWPLTDSDFPTNQTFHQFHNRDTEIDFDLHQIMSGFHEAFATGVVCQQGTLTLPDTWFRPLFGTCLCFNCWDQIPRTCHVFGPSFPWYFRGFASFIVTVWYVKPNNTEFNQSEPLRIRNTSYQTKVNNNTFCMVFNITTGGFSTFLCKTYADIPSLHDVTLKSICKRRFGNKLIYAASVQGVV